MRIEQVLIVITKFLPKKVIGINDYLPLSLIAITDLAGFQRPLDTCSLLIFGDDIVIHRGTSFGGSGRAGCNNILFSTRQPNHERFIFQKCRKKANNGRKLLRNTDKTPTFAAENSSKHLKSLLLWDYLVHFLNRRLTKTLK